MDKHLYLFEEFVNLLNVQRQDLQVWQELKLIVPVGYTDDKIACFSKEQIDLVRHIQKFKELGYQNEDIQKIIKKVGLPNRSEMKQNNGYEKQYLTIGNLSESVGVSPRTIKHWEDKGIIEPDMRSEGGFRLYSQGYVYLCQLIMDLQHFGYSLEDIKRVSDYFRLFLSLKQNLKRHKAEDAEQMLNEMMSAIENLHGKMGQLKKGIQRWEELLKKNRKEIQALISQNKKRTESAKAK